MGGRAFRRIRQIIRDESGNVIVETAAVMPMVVLLTLGLVTLGFVANNYVTLNSATWAAARAVAVDTPTLLAGQVSTTFTPWTDLKTTLQSQVNPQSGTNQVFNGWLSAFNASPAATGGVTVASVCVHAAGAACATPTCTSASCTDAVLNTALTSAATSNSVVTVNTSYPCFIPFAMYGFTGCTLTASASVAVQ